MSRNEIRLRRQRMTASGANRFRNYSDVLQRHEKDMRIRKIMRVFLMFMLIVMLVGIMYFITQLEKQEEPVKPAKPETTTHSGAYAPDLSKTP